MATTQMRHFLPVGGKFLGSHIYAANLSVENDTVRMPTFDGSFALVSTGVTAHMELELGYSAATMNHLECGSHIGYRDIGWGHVCRYCGTTYTTGVLTCPQCGGGTDLLDKAVERAKWTGWLVGIDRTLNSETWPAIKVTLLLGPGFCFTTNEERVPDWGAMLGDVGFVSQPKARLCPWCGALCDWNSHTCKFCGGNRLPEKELQNLTRECWHCGATTVGNYICEKCNATLNFNEQYRKC